MTQGDCFGFDSELMDKRKAVTQEVNLEGGAHEVLPLPADL